MKHFRALIFGVFAFTASAQAAVVIPHKNLNCTADLNEWGQSSSCGCKEPTRYDERIGYCILGEFKHDFVSGAVTIEQAAEGKKATITLKPFDNSGKTYQLVLRESDYQFFLNKKGLPFEVEGGLINLPSANGSRRPAVVVERYFWLD